MFEYNEEIEDKYLWNFTSAEKKHFHHEHRQLQQDLVQYQGKLYELMAEDSPAIFANYDPKASSALSIKYTFNRLYADDSRETELCLNYSDPAAPRNAPYVDQIIWALKDNTNCRRIVLNGVRTKETWWRSRGINDREASVLLDMLASKKLSELTIAHYPLLTDHTYSKMADIISHSSNRWDILILGSIRCSKSTQKRLLQSNKVQFSRICPEQERE